jgi:DNA-binding XRE family transcriptional regulator
MQRGRTLPCKICGELYTDNIDPAVDPGRGGYIICARCTMRLADAPAAEVEIDPQELVDAIKDKKLAKYRKSLGLTQEDLAGRLGIKRTQYYKIEKGQYIPSLRVLNRFKSKLMHTKPLAA